MLFITEQELGKLIEVENYLGKKENWSENTCKIWEVIEAITNRHLHSKVGVKEKLNGEEE